MRWFRRKRKVPVVRAGDVILLDVSGREVLMTLSSVTFNRTQRTSALFLEKADFHA